MRGQQWAHEDVAIAARIYAERFADGLHARGKVTAVCREIAAALGRNDNQVQYRLSTYGASFASQNRKHDIRRMTAPNSVLVERDRRREAEYRRDLTATLLGDPPPGYSARDRSRVPS